MVWSNSWNLVVSMVPLLNAMKILRMTKTMILNTTSFELTIGDNVSQIYRQSQMLNYTRYISADIRQLSVNSCNSV